MELYLILNTYTSYQGAVISLCPQVSTIHDWFAVMAIVSTTPRINKRGETDKADVEAMHVLQIWFVCYLQGLERTSFA